MAKFDGEVGNDIMQNMDRLGLNGDVVFGEMVGAGADLVLRNVRSNMRSSFKSSRSLEAGLGKTRVYKSGSDDGVNVKVGFRGYSPQHKSKKFNSGVPIPLIAIAREKGSNVGMPKGGNEKSKPFFRKSFNKSAINAEMTRIEAKLFKGVI